MIAATQFAKGDLVHAEASDGRLARGHVVAFVYGLHGDIIAYELLNPVSHITMLLWPEEHTTINKHVRAA